MTFESPGKLAYNRYCTMQNGVGHGGQKLVPWEELSEEKQDQWERGALQLLQARDIIKEVTKPEARPRGRRKRV